MFSKVRLYWSLAGIGFGLLFPIVGLSFDFLFLNRKATSLADLIAANPIHLIVMMAPLVIGGCFTVIGRMHARQLYQLLRIRVSESAQKRLANTDSLTGCGNRHKCMNEIRLVLSDTTGIGAPPQILLIDLDKFKSVNDSLGHNVGDVLLQEVARRIERIETDNFWTLYRLGGDEFILLFLTPTDDEAVNTHAEAILAQMTTPFLLAKSRVSIGASIGIATIEPGDELPEQVLSRADLALYTAKRQGGNCWRRFNPDMAVRAQQTMQMEQDLRMALERDELFVDYQPIFSMDGRSVRGVEALVRWNHPEKGLLQPSEFIPVAENSGLIVPLGEIVLNKACRAAASWPDSVGLSVNVSVEQFKNPDFYEQVVVCLAKTGMPARRLTLEITESLLIDNMDLVAQCFDRLRELGISFALDDFGTGFSSINHLRRLHLDYLKLDKSFLTNLADNSQELDLIDSVLRLSRSFNLVTTMEGIEHSEQLELMKSHGVDRAQGFYLARPMDTHSLVDLFSRLNMAGAPSTRRASSG